MWEETWPGERDLPTVFPQGKFTSPFSSTQETPASESLSSYSQLDLSPCPLHNSPLGQGQVGAQWSLSLEGGKNLEASGQYTQPSKGPRTMSS